jgi:hypothetical protein
MAGQDSNTKLLLHFNGTDGATETTDATGRHGTINFNGNAQLDTAEKKFGSASLLLDGTGDYLDLPDSNDWDICASNSDNWTVDFWVKHSVYSGQEGYMTHYQNLQNRWYFYHNDSGVGIAFLLYTSNAVDFYISGGQIVDSNWHHVSLCKVGNKYGIYKDGVQVAYGTTDLERNVTGSLYIGRRGDNVKYFNGSVDELRIQHSNYFDASPNAELTDTITVPTEEYSEVKLKRNRGIIIS